MHVTSFTGIGSTPAGIALSAFASSSKAPDTATLTRAAEITGGKANAGPKEVFDPAGETVTFHEDLWSRFIGAAIGVYLLDLLLRRLRLFDRKKTARPSLARAAG